MFSYFETNNFKLKINNSIMKGVGRKNNIKIDIYYKVCRLPKNLNIKKKRRK